MLEAFLEPVQTEEDDKGVDGDWIAHHGYDQQDKLLISTDEVDVDGVETTLGSSTAGKEERIYVVDPAVRKYEDRAYDSHPNDEGIVQMDEHELRCHAHPLRFESLKIGPAFHQPCEDCHHAFVLRSEVDLA